MTPVMLLEVWASLALQVALIVCIVGWATHQLNRGYGADWCWAAVHVEILILTAAAFLLPHLRPVTLADFSLSLETPILATAFQVVGRVCGWLWLAGTVTLVFAMVGGLWRAARLVRDATPHDELTQLANSSSPYGAARALPVQVRVSSICISPFCWQLHRPVVVVPDLVLEFPLAQQAALLRHELAHLRAQHPLQLFLQRLVEAIYWFHPLVWWASYRAGAAREFRCDRDAVSTRQEVADYLRSMLRLVEAQIPPPNFLPAGLGFLGDTSLLSRRADALADSVDRPVARWSICRPAVAMLSAAVVCLVVWLPINPQASRRALWSPWPSWSANALDASGIRVRDYEIDGHRLRHHEHR